MRRARKPIAEGTDEEWQAWQRGRVARREHPHLARQPIYASGLGLYPDNQVLRIEFERGWDDEDAAQAAKTSTDFSPGDDVAFENVFGRIMRGIIRRVDERGVGVTAQPPPWTFCIIQPDELEHWERKHGERWEAENTREALEKHYREVGIKSRGPNDPDPRAA